jgi:DMSO/TMAO reductase YedYZ molybdopterin-dependent catalytic subunit
MAGPGTRGPKQRAARLQRARPPREARRRAARRRRGLASAAAEFNRAALMVRRAADAVRHPAEHPPPGPFRPGVWRSPLRGLWLTSVLGVVLLAGLTILAVTGLLSYAAYDPLLPGNDQTPGAGLLRFYMFSWPTHPSWLYRVDQGVHVTLGLALLPVVLAKLWSVLPRLFAWPPVRSLAQILERVSLVMLVGGVLFEFATGILNIQNYYVFPFSFYTAHLYGAWVFIAGFVIHVALKFPRMLTGLRSRSLRRELHTPLSQTRPEDPDTAAPDPVEPDTLEPDRAEPEATRPGAQGLRSAAPRTVEGLRAARPRAPTISRRGLLAAIGGASLTLAGLVVGQSVGGWTRRTSLFGPRGLSATAPHYLPVNRTAASIGLTAADVGPGYRLTLTGARTVTLTQAELLRLPQRTVELPIACVEGWSVAARWTGVRLADLARLAGTPAPAGAQVDSIQQVGAFKSAVLSASQVADPQSLLAVTLNGHVLPWDHGYPARTIIPNAPGVHNTKWVSKITFLEQA